MVLLEQNVISPPHPIQRDGACMSPTRYAPGFRTNRSHLEPRGLHKTALLRSDKWGASVLWGTFCTPEYDPPLPPACLLPFYSFRFRVISQLVEMRRLSARTLQGRSELGNATTQLSLLLHAATRREAGLSLCSVPLRRDHHCPGWERPLFPEFVELHCLQHSSKH